MQSAELYRTQAIFYGRFEARVQFAPGEGVVSSYFLWKDGSSSTTSWNELDYEKTRASCQMQTNIWSGMGSQTPLIASATADRCSAYHTYTFEWTPDYIAWFVDGTQLRRETGAVVAEYTQNAAQGMTIHFNVWVGNASFGGVLDPSMLPMNEYIDWVQYSSYANGTFQQEWREDFDGAGIPAGWAVGNWQSPFNLSVHNPANVNIVNGVAVLSMTADDATGYSGTPPVDTATNLDGGCRRVAQLRWRLRVRQPGRWPARTPRGRRSRRRNRGHDVSATAPFAAEVADGSIRRLNLFSSIRTAAPGP